MSSDKGSNRYSVAEAVALMSAGKLTSRRLAEDCLERIDQRESEVGAWTYINPQQVLAQARACDREPRRSLLHGIPVGVKDIIDTSDMPTEYGSPIYAGYQPRSDAACISILRNAGAIIMGKTVLTEFAQGIPGKTRNPHNLKHTPGGSSSGSAAAVADFMTPLALSTQGAGSTLRPAAYCGIVGFKPTFNVINRAGVKPVNESLDTLGIMGRTIADVRLTYSVLTDSVATLNSFDGNAPKIGFCRTSQWAHAQPATIGAMENAVSALRRAGASVKEVVLPSQFDAMQSVCARIYNYESCRGLSHEFRYFRNKLSRTLLEKFEKTSPTTLIEYVTAQQQAAVCRQLLPQVFSEHDVLLTPSAPGEAPYGLNKTGDSIFNRMWTALYVPAVTIPVSSDPLNLPIGLQLVGPFGADYRLLECAHWIQHKLSSII